MSAIKDMTGLRVGRLLVIGRDGASLDGKAKWRCKCDCGSSVIVSGKRLRNGETKSCGCFRVETATRLMTTHGACVNRNLSRAYRTWAAMKQRCKDANCESYKNYGGRGIKVCARWQDFENFLADMGQPPPGMTIERDDVNGNYELANCRWATSKEQGFNRRNNRVIEFKGRKLTVTEWALEIALPLNTLISRLNRGWSVDSALTTPVKSLPKSLRLAL